MRNRSQAIHTDAGSTHRIVLLPRFVQECLETSFCLEARITGVDNFLSESDHGLFELQFALGQRSRLTLQNVISAGCNERSKIRLFSVQYLWIHSLLSSNNVPCQISSEISFFGERTIPLFRSTRHRDVLYRWWFRI